MAELNDINLVQIRNWYNYILLMHSLTNGLLLSFFYWFVTEIQHQSFKVCKKTLNSSSFNFLSSQIFFVATIATVLAVPYYPALQVYSNGAVAPVETPEVQHEKAKHFAAHAERSHGYAPVHAVYSAPHAYGYHVPVIHNGESRFIFI